MGPLLQSPLGGPFSEVLLYIVLTDLQRKVIMESVVVFCVVELLFSIEITVADHLHMETDEKDY